MQLNGSSILHTGQQLSSPLQLQQRHESSLDDRHKASTSSNDIKPLLSSVVQPSVIPLGDAPSIQKACLLTFLKRGFFFWGCGGVWDYILSAPCIIKF